jgi:hypothetical protein
VSQRWSVLTSATQLHQVAKLNWFSSLTPPLSLVLLILSMNADKLMSLIFVLICYTVYSWNCPTEFVCQVLPCQLSFYEVCKYIIQFYFCNAQWGTNYFSQYTHHLALNEPKAHSVILHVLERQRLRCTSIQLVFSF